MSFSFDYSRLYLLGITSTYRFSLSGVSKDCFMLALGKNNLNQNLEAVYFGTDQDDNCTALALNRYNWQVVTCNSKYSSSSR